MHSPLKAQPASSQLSLSFPKPPKILKNAAQRLGSPLIDYKLTKSGKNDMFFVRKAENQVNDRKDWLSGESSSAEWGDHHMAPDGSYRYCRPRLFPESKEALENALYPSEGEFNGERNYGAGKGSEEVRVKKKKERMELGLDEMCFFIVCLFINNFSWFFVDFNCIFAEKLKIYSKIL